MSQYSLQPYTDPFIYFSPRSVFHQTLTIMKKHENQLTERALQQLNEMQCASIFALGLTLADKDERWLRNPLPTDATPDAYIASLRLTDEGRNRIIQEHEIEIVTYEKHSTENLVNFLLYTKLHPHKAYAKYSGILCQLNKNFHMDSWKEMHKTLLPNMNGLQINFLSRVSHLEPIFKVISMGPKDSEFFEGDEYSLLDVLDLPAKDLITPPQFPERKLVGWSTSPHLRGRLATS